VAERLTPTTSTGLQLLLTAERLFARHGIDGVSLRQIAVAAGSSNNSAVRYHFGSKDELLHAILAYRLGDLIRRRGLLVQRADPADLRARVEAHLLPLLEMAEAPDSHYVCFVEQLQRSGAEAVIAGQPDVQRSRAELATAMRGLLGDLPEPALTVRIEQAQDLCLHLAAERERAVNRGDTRLPFALYVSTAVDAVAGLLAAPASAETAGLIARPR
jgi:AcrR family transcriptional regulator